MYYIKVGNIGNIIFIYLKYLIIIFNSGGVKRKWTGVPRKLQTVDESGKLSVRCACVQLDELNEIELSHIVEYDNCDPSSTICYVNIS